ncbi:TolC family outer membrane protein [Comamonas sp. Y33R10-2]|uniref:TolC family outer membrane protein n=1 Tax=Comamonas sp. Y33R10-2 TaxID=2853257 RepID=UPI001C5CB87F|nr:TolC family outer membrane protein [Comamonas sp. Y33R10-2]QXZ09719.1 TolC family outer membrane protein [Comamonas sp. Y33R10-2]
MSMAAAVQAAVAWHPSVRLAQGQLLGADEGIAVAKAGYKPQVSGGIGSQTSNNVIAPYSSRHIYDARISVSQMIYDFGKVDSAVQQAEATVSTAQAQVQLSSEDVARETALAWVEVRRQQALVEVANAQVIGVKALADLALERQIKGASTKSDSVQAQSRVESAAATAINYSAQAQRWRVRLMYLIGAKELPLVSSELPSALPLACSASNGPDALLPAAVLKAIGQRDLAKADLKAADAQLKPTLSLDGSVARGLSNGSRPVGYSELDTRIMLNLSAPLYEGGRNQARQRAAAHALDAADSAVAYAQFQAQQTLQDAFAQTVGQQQRAPVIDARISSIRTTRDLYREQYLQLGTRSLLDLLNAEQEYHIANLDRVESFYEIQRLAVECLYQSGRMRTVFELPEPVVAQGGVR